jgi:cobalt/nickel transport system permease protein
VARQIGRSAFLIDEWSSRRSTIHSLDPRIKIGVCLALLVTIAIWPLAWVLFLPLILLSVAAHVPPTGVLLRAAVVIPFTLIFAAITAWSGDWPSALRLLWKSYLSATCVVLLVSTTPVEKLLAGAARLGVPGVLLEVTHFTWRYIGVIGAQAWRMRTAALARGAERSFEVSASSLTTLFASSYARAERIHRAMLARDASGGRP